jgi:cell division protein FtsI/penicillin-binding protein 2
MKTLAVQWLFQGLSLLLCCWPAQAQRLAASDDLYGQATSAMLDRSFPSRRIDYLLMDPRTGKPIAMRWPHVDAPIPAGSLLKPFVALAYAELHAEAALPVLFSDSRFPVVVCHGRSDGCWRRAGHGSMSLEHALALSCNAYFLALARSIYAAGISGTEALELIRTRYGLPALPAPATPANLIGLSPGWRIPPLTLAHAYAALAVGTTPLPNSYVAARLLAGLKQATEGGTASRVGPHAGGVLAKTGTAPCISEPWPNPEPCIANGDGLVILLAPADAPRLLLLVRQRGTTGARAAEVAGRMLALLEHEEARNAAH